MGRYCNGREPYSTRTPPVSSLTMTLPRGASLLLASLAVVLAGLAAARVALDPKVVIDRDAEWREVCLGCRRDGGSGDALAVSRLALVHLHGLSGRAATLELTLSAPGSPVALDVARSLDETALIQAKLGEAPQPVRLRVEPGQRDADVWLRANSTKGLPMLLHRLVLQREPRAVDRLFQFLPLGVGLAVLWLMARRQPMGIALVFALASLAGAVLALQVLHDPVALLETEVGAARARADRAGRAPRRGRALAPARPAARLRGPRPGRHPALPAHCRPRARLGRLPVGARMVDRGRRLHLRGAGRSVRRVERLLPAALGAVARHGRVDLGRPRGRLPRDEPRAAGAGGGGRPAAPGAARALAPGGAPRRAGLDRPPDGRLRGGLGEPAHRPDRVAASTCPPWPCFFPRSGPAAGRR